MAMTVKQIREALAQIPDDAEILVFLSDEDAFEETTEFGYDNENNQCWFTILEPMEEDEDEAADDDEEGIEARAALEAEKQGKGGAIDVDFIELPKRKKKFGRSTKDGSPTPL